MWHVKTLFKLIYLQPILYFACILYHLHFINDKITFHIISILSPTTVFVKFANHHMKGISIQYMLVFCIIICKHCSTAIRAFSMCDQWYYIKEDNKFLYNFIQKIMNALFIQKGLTSPLYTNNLTEIHNRVFIHHAILWIYDGTSNIWCLRICFWHTFEFEVIYIYSYENMFEIKRKYYLIYIYYPFDWYKKFNIEFWYK